MSNVVLSDEQVAILNWFATGTGNAMVLARAGTGKTFTIIQGITKAPETRICYAVFNKKNKLEAEAKISDSRVDVKTLHGLGFSFIRRQWQNIKPDDQVETDRINAVAPNIPGGVLVCVRKTVDWAKNTTCGLPTLERLLDIIEAKGLEPEDDYIRDGWTIRRVAEAALAAMKKSCERDAQGRISFTDMVWLPVAMRWCRPWYDLVVIDEAQDQSLPQLTMAQYACKKTGRIMVVGDDRQCIYGFRGAMLSGMSMMQEKLKAAVFPLTITRRCPKAVVEIAATLVPDYRAADDAPQGEVRTLTSAGMLAEIAIGDAVLSRKNAPLMPTCLALLRKGVSARIEGRDIGKQLLAIAQKLKARSVPDFIKRATAWGERQTTRALGGKNAEERIDAVTDQVETLVAVAEGAASVGEIETRLVTLFSDSDSNPRPAVVLSSVHRAKGLEYEKVFLLRGTFRGQLGNVAVSEEQNLLYVGITRVKSTLVWVVDEKTAK